ncbi:hypothetical protein D3C84_932390 [compost metagenome]
MLSNHDGKGQDVDVTDGYKTDYLSELRNAIVLVESDIYTMSKMGKDVVCRGFLETLAPLDQKAMGQLVAHS